MTSSKKSVSLPPMEDQKFVPLSDPQNEGRWKVYDLFCDEFDSPKLDSKKWSAYNRSWKGRAPVYFDSNNVSVANGRLMLTVPPSSSIDKSKLPEDFTHTSGFVQSKMTVKYGYFEIKAKLMDANLVSGFWFSNSDNERSTEIDVVEIAAGADKWRNKITSNTHVFKFPNLKEEIHGPAMVTNLSFDPTKDFHVYGLEWTEKTIRIYVDGKLVQERANKYWKQPLYMNINNEANVGWVGESPKDSQLPANYEIEYVRTWKSYGMYSEDEGGISELKYSFSESTLPFATMGSWSVKSEGDNKYLSLSDPSGWFTQQIPHFGQWSDFKWDMKVRFTKPLESGSMNWIFNGENSECLRIFIGSNNIKLVRYQGNQQVEEIAKSDFVTQPNKWYVYSLQYDDQTNMVAFFVDGKKVLSAEDKNFQKQAGPYAFASWKTAFDVDDFSVTYLKK